MGMKNMVRRFSFYLFQICVFLFLSYFASILTYTRISRDVKSIATRCEINLKTDDSSESNFYEVQTIPRN